MGLYYPANHSRDHHVRRRSTSPTTEQASHDRASKNQVSENGDRFPADDEVFEDVKVIEIGLKCVKVKLCQSRDFAVKAIRVEEGKKETHVDARLKNGSNSASETHGEPREYGGNAERKKDPA